MISPHVLETTRQILSESLGVSDEEVQLTSYLIDDLGAESIDFLDIFHLAEVRLGIRISEADFGPQGTMEHTDDEEWEADVNRDLTPAELDEMREKMPLSTHDRIVPGLHVYEIIRLVNVEMLATFFDRKVSELKASATLEVAS